VSRDRQPLWKAAESYANKSSGGDATQAADVSRPASLASGAKFPPATNTKPCEMKFCSRSSLPSAEPWQMDVQDVDATFDVFTPIL
jgi:hypothetical protein